MTLIEAAIEVIRYGTRDAASGLMSQELQIALDRLSRETRAAQSEQRLAEVNAALKFMHSTDVNAALGVSNPHPNKITFY